MLTYSFIINEIWGYNDSGSRKKLQVNITKPLTDYIKELLADDNKLQAIADNAYSLCHNRHDWKNRASIIEALLR